LDNRFVTNKSKRALHASGIVGASTPKDSNLPTTIVKVPIAELKLDPKNPRIHGERQIQLLAKSIERFGFLWPVMIDGARRVLAGYGRITAAIRLGFQCVPTILVDHLSESQRRAFMIADNRLAEQASWDEKLLGEHFKELCDLELDFDLDTTGFEVGEIDVLIEGLAPATDGPDPADSLPENQKSVPVTKPGDLWLLRRHRVLCGNALNAASFCLLMENRNAAMVFVDPPYNVPIVGHATGLGAIRHREFAMAAGDMSKSKYTDFLARGFSLLSLHSVQGSIHFVCCDWRHIAEALDAGHQVYSELKNLCVWVKDNGGMGTFYRSQHELIFAFKSGEASHRNNFQLGQFGRHRTNVWNYPGVNSFSRNTAEGNLLEFHPTVKPVALVADAIMDVSARADIVLDCFLGSGTTLIASERTGRTCYGMELDPLYVDTIVRRWQRFTGLSATHAESGRKFDELEKEAFDAIR
jgi:DNA modification methylase